MAPAEKQAFRGGQLIMNKNTIMFDGFKDNELDKKAVLVEIYTALTERGYNAIDQIVGYLTSGDPSYITSHNNARNLILKIDRDELLEEILKVYLDIYK